MLFIIILIFVIAAKGSEDRCYRISTCQSRVVRTVLKEKPCGKQRTRKTLPAGNDCDVPVVGAVSTEVRVGHLAGAGRDSWERGSPAFRLSDSSLQHIS